MGDIRHTAIGLLHAIFRHGWHRSSLVGLELGCWS